MCGGPFIPPSVVQLGQNVILGAAIFVSVLFAAHFVRTWIAGNRPNPVKLGLLVTSIAFWWYCNNLVSNILVGIALFEVFHDVQYLSLVWIYNRNRVEKDSNIGGFMRFVFRRSGSLVGLYVGLVFAYGSVSYINAHIGMETVKRILTGVVTASTLAPFLLRRIYLESSGAFDPSIARTRRRNRRCIARRYASQLGVARLEMGRRIRRATRRIVVLANASRRSRCATHGVGGGGCA